MIAAPPRPTTTLDLLRTQIKDLLDAWLDSDDIERDSLLRMLARHLQPTRMADTNQSVKAAITNGPAPWDDPVAHLLADISAGARTIERGLDIDMSIPEPDTMDWPTRPAWDAPWKPVPRTFTIKAPMENAQYWVGGAADDVTLCRWEPDEEKYVPVTEAVR